MLKKEAREITGGLSKPSKMPGPAHNLPAQACNCLLYTSDAADE